MAQGNIKVTYQFNINQGEPNKTKKRTGKSVMKSGWANQRMKEVDCVNDRGVDSDSKESG